MTLAETRRGKAGTIHSGAELLRTAKASRFEADGLRLLEVLGELPAALEGSYFRCGADDAYPHAAGRHHREWRWHGLRCFILPRGKADFRCRYVKTERYLAEAPRAPAACRQVPQCFSRMHQRWPAWIVTTPPTTSAFWHHGRLYAPARGFHSHRAASGHARNAGSQRQFKSQLQTRTMTAHPKIDPVTGEWWSTASSVTRNIATKWH
jgi:carotenoid cleavage dioxygenase